MLKKILESFLKKKLLISMITFVVLVVGISLGSSIITRTLSIGGKTKINDCDWNIHFEDITINPNSVLNTDSTKNARITDSTTKRNISFSTNLSSVGDFYEFDVYTVNDSNCDMDAMIDSIELEGITNEQKKYITYSIKYDDADIQTNDEYYSSKYEYTNKKLEKCDPLYEQTRRKIKVRVSLRKEIETDSLELNFNFKINYVQLDDSCSPTSDTKHTLTIKPNGGKYDDSSSDTTIELAEGEDYELLIPTHDDFDFMLWEVISPTENGTYSFEHNKYFRMGEEDVTIRAKWDENYVASIGMCNFYQTVQSAFTAMKDGYTVSEDKNGQKIYQNYTCNPNDKTVYLLKNHTENVSNEATTTFKFNLLGHTLTGTVKNGDEDKTNMNLTLVNGKIISPSNKNEAVTNYGTLTMGENDDVVNVENSISLVGNKNGLVNKSSAIFNFYDGYIDAIEKDNELGEVISVELPNLIDDSQRVFTPDNYHIIIDELENGSRAYLILNPNRAVAKITTGYVRFYSNLQKAFNDSIESKREASCNPSTNCNEKEIYTVYAIRDFEAAYTLNVENDERVYFDTKGYNIKFGDTITNSGYLNIYDSENPTQIPNKILISKSIDNNGTLVIDNKDINSELDANIINNSGSLTINKSTVLAKKGYAINNRINGTITLDSNTTIKAEDNYGIYNESNALVLSDGNIYGLNNNGRMALDDNVKIYSKKKKTQNNSYIEYIPSIYNTNLITMNGGYITTDENIYAVRNSGTINITDGLIDGKEKTGIDNLYGTINASGGEIKSSSLAISSGYVNVSGNEQKGGKVTSTTGTAISGSTITIDGYKTIVQDEHGDDVEVFHGEIVSDNIAVSSSDITVEGGLVKGDEYAIYSSNTTINGGDVRSDNVAINSATVTMNGGNVSGDSNGIIVNNLTMNGGNVNSDNGIGIIVNNDGTIIGGNISGGMYGVQNKNKLTIGVDDYTDAAHTNPIIATPYTPVIKGDLYGLYIDDNTTTNFYDGILEGVSDGYNGEINGMPTGAIIATGTEEIGGVTYKTDYVLVYEDWLRVGENTYNSINAASNAIESSGTIEVIRDVSDIIFEQEFVNHPEDPENTSIKNIVFDLNGHTITSTQSITNNVHLTIVDSSDGHTGTINPIKNVGIINNEYLKLDGGTYKTTLDTPILNKGTMVVDNALFDVTNKGITNGTSGYSSAELTINNIEFKVNDDNSFKAKTGIYNDGTVVMKNGSIKATDYGIYCGVLARSAKLENGIIEANDTAVSAPFDAGFEMDNGVVSSKTGNAIYTNGGSVTIHNGTVTSLNNTGIYAGGIITIDGGNITGTRGIENHVYRPPFSSMSFWADIIINDGVITGTTDYGILGNGGKTLYIYDGTITGKLDGVYANITTQIGRDDGNISITSPVLIGERYAININSYTKFFDGILKAKDNDPAHNGLIAQIPDGKLVKQDTEFINRVEYYTEYLVEFGNWLKVGDQEFNSINAAAAAIDAEGTITVIADVIVNVNMNDVVHFPQILPIGKNITFDLNGHNVIMTKPIEVKGTATFIDSRGNGSLNNVRDNAIVNEGTTIIKNGNYYSDTSSTILNKGNLTVEGGTVSTLVNENSTDYPKVYAITNNNALNINGGIVKGYGGIDNYKTLIVNDGNIEGTNIYSINNNNSTTINGGTIVNNSTNTVYNVGSSLSVTGGNITSTTANAMYLTNYSSYDYYSLNISGGNITGYINGIYLGDFKYDAVISDGNITGQTDKGFYSVARDTLVTGGKIRGKTYGIYTNNKLTLGSDDGNLDIGLPELKGDLYGLYIDGLPEINFYDGIIIGKSGRYYGDITNIATDSRIIEDEELDEVDNSTWLRAYLHIDETMVKNLATGVEYNNLDRAMEEVVNQIPNPENPNEMIETIPTLQIIANAPIYYDVVNEDKKFILDMNGHTLSTNKGITNESLGDISIINSSNNEAKIKTSSPLSLLYNEGNLKINNVTLENNSASNYILNNDSNLEIINTKINGINCLRSTSDLKVTNSTLNAQNNAINSSGKLNIVNGTYKGNSYSIYSNTNQNVNIDSVNLSGIYYNAGNNTTVVNNSRLNSNVQNYSNNMTISSSEIYGSTGQGLQNGGVIVLDDVDFNITTLDDHTLYEYVVISNTGRMTINDSDINIDKNITGRNKVYVINNNNELYINDSNIDIGKGEISSNIYIGINANSNSTATINNSNIKVDGGDTIYGVYTNDINSSVILKTGMIKLDNSNTSYGAYIKQGSFTMGENEGGTPSDDNPIIYSSGVRGIGIKKLNASFNFYDGKIWATRYSKPETTTNAPTNYEATMYMSSIGDVGYEFCHLEYMPENYENSGVAELNDVHYDTIQEAIDKATDGDTIKILKSTTENIRITTGKNISINLNEHSITADQDDLIHTKSVVIDTGASLTIYNGSLQNSENTTVINNGTFIMGIDDGNVSSVTVRVISEANALENNGTFIIYDGYLEGENALIGEVTAKADMSRIYTIRDDQSEKKYLQSLSREAIENGETDLIITIDPNNGLYEGSKDIKTVYRKFHENYELTYPPQKNGCDFVGWEITENNNVYLLTGNTITMDYYDIDVKLLWEVSSSAVAHIGDDYYTSLENAITAANDNDEIILLKDINSDITVPNNKNIKINLDGHKITGAFTNNGTLKLVNGTVENPNGIGIVNNKTLTLGENDNEVSENSIKIIGTSVGLEQNGRLNFYDGYIDGEIALDGSVTNVPQGFYIYTNHIDSGGNVIQRVFLIGNPTNAVAIIDSGTTQYFFNLQDAINASKILNREVKIIKNFEGSYPIEVKENYDTTINMQGHSITLGSTITNNGSLKLYDSTETPGEINIVNEINNVGSLEVNGISIKEISSNRTINNSGYLKLDNATITSTSANAIYTTGTMDILNNTSILADSSYAINNNQTEKLVLNTGTISGIYNQKELELDGDVVVRSTANNLAGIYEYSNSTLTINDGTIGATNNRAIYLPYNANNITVTINGGNITSSSEAIYVESGNNIIINITGGEITSTGSHTLTYNSSYNSSISNTLNIIGGTITNGVSANDRYCLNLGERLNVTISGDAKVITNSSSGIWTSSPNLTVNGAEISTQRNDGFGIYLYVGEVNIEGNTKIITTGLSSIGIFTQEYASTINMSSGEIISSNVGIRATNWRDGQKTINIDGGSISGETYGISLDSPKVTVNVGNNDNELSTTIPYITGGTYGIYKENGTVNFYNGRLRGITYGYNNELNSVRRGKDIAEELEYPEYPGVETTSTTNVSDGAISEYAKKGNGFAKITYLGDSTGACQYGEEYSFSYVGHVDIFDTPCTGEYKLEVWGAQGGHYDDTHYGGYGGYSTGKITLTTGEKLYVTVGGAGTIARNSTASGGYNGGGSAITAGNDDYAGSGGGATHIATSSGLLSELSNNKSSVIIVAGGGGGAYHYYSTFSGAGGSGGGYIGGASQNINCYGRTLSTGTPASQTSPSTNNGCYLASTYESSFGQGSSYTQWSAGGGGGYYGGGFGYATGASGGSGYIGNSRLSESRMFGYKVTEQIHSYVNNYLVEKDDFLQVGEETFNTFEDAIAAVESTGTIKVIKDVTANEQAIFTSGKTITFDLNGHTLNTTLPITNEGDLTVTDLTNDKKGKILNTQSNVINNKGNLIVEYVELNAKNSVIYAENGTGTIEVNNANLIGSTGIYLKSEQQVTIDSTTINTTDNSILNEVNNSTLRIIDSNLTSENNRALLSDGYKITADIENSNLKGFYSAIYIYRDGSVLNVKGGELSSTITNTDYYVLQLYSNATYSLDGTKIKTDNTNGIYIYGNNLKLDLKDVEINAKVYGIYSYYGEINIDGDTKITTTGTNSYGIRTEALSTLNFNSGEINSEYVGIGTVDYRDNVDSINIYGGKIVGKTYGIVTDIASVTLNIGKSDEELSTTIPYIEGGKYGIYNTNGTVKFYNGRLVGKTFGYKNEIDYVRPKKSIYTELVLGENGNPVTYTISNVSDEPISEYAKAGNGYAKLTYLGETNGICQNNQEYTFSYTGGEQTFNVPCEGNYKIEVWGAAGGYTSESKHGGYGGYSKGTIELDDDETLYINVGGQGTTGESSTGGYNGGGSGASSGGSGGGGGATHIATQSGLLQELSNSIESILIVAGGGGGYANWGCSVSIGGSGGGYQGALATNTSSEVNNTGGTQSNGGVSNGAAAGSFGLGGYQNVSGYSTPGAGSGFYGGGTGHDYCGAGGGSGYISNTRLSNGAMYGYKVPSDNTIYNYLVDKDGFLQVGEQVFNSLDDAVAAITDTGTIKVLNDGYIQEESTIPSGKNITIDLNGRTLNTTVTIVNNGNLTITDLTNDKNGKIVNSRSDVIENNSNVTIKDISIENSSNTVIAAKTGTGNVVIDNSTLNSKYGVYLYSAQNVNINNSTITTRDASIYNSVNNSNLTINNSTLTSETTTIFSNYNSVIADITNSIISGNTRAMYLDSNNNIVNVTGGEFRTTSTNTDYYVLQLYGNSTYYLDGCKVENLNGNGILIQSNSPQLTLNDVEINAKLYGVYSYGGDIFVSGNTRITTIGSNSYGIRTEALNSLNFNSGEIHSENIGIGTVSYRDNVREINISGGKIIGKTYGLVTDIQNVNVNIINYNDIDSITEPYIEGGTYGIYRTAGTINFYSGRLVGQTKAYYDSINNIKEGYELYDDSEGVNNTEVQKDVLSTTSHSSTPLAGTVKEGNGYAKITYTGQNVVKSKLKYEEYNYFDNNRISTFTYTGSQQSFIPTFKGKYKIELWGAQGGYRSNPDYGGKGAYVSGYLDLDVTDELLVYVGASGNNGGYNGGGTRTIGHNGGGATDIRLTSSLYSRIMVAAGGGSDGADSRPGGYGGALEGQTRTESYGTGGGGATQTAGGSFNGEFGQGGDGISQNGGHGGAGGGGWYGGGATQPDGSVDDDRGGGGGSSFVYTETATLPSGYLVDSKYMVSDSLMFSGGESMPSSLGSGIVTGNKGDGLAKITLISIDGEYNEVHARFITEQGSVNQEIKTYDKNDTLGTLEVPTISNPNISFAGWYLEPTYENQVDSSYVITKDINLYAKFVYNNQSCSLTPGTTYEFNYTGSEQTFTAQCLGIYKIETWGAQGGGTVNDSIIGGYGAYASGEIELLENGKLYINVGGQGGISTSNTVLNGGYNGGGNARSYGSSYSFGSGGGATHIATSSGLLKDLKDNKNSVIMVAAGGGGGGSYYTSQGNSGTSGGGVYSKGITNGNTTTGATKIGPGSGYKGQGGFGYGATLGNEYGPGAGSGYYGGGADSDEWGATGGSSYVDIDKLNDRKIYSYQIYDNEYANVVYLVKAHDIVKNTTTDTKYKNIQVAIDNANTGDTLELISDANISYPLTINSDDNITLDLKGYDLQTTKTITNNGIFNITNSNGNSDSKLFTTLTMSLIINNNNLNISNVTVSGTKTIDNSTNGVYVINNSNIIGTTYAIYDSSNTTNTITNSTVKATTNAIYIYSTAVVNTNGTNFEGIVNTYNSSSELHITGGEIKGVIYNVGQATISSFSIKNNVQLGYDYLVYNGGTMTLSNSDIIHTSETYYRYYCDLIRNYGTFTTSNNNYKSLAGFNNRDRRTIAILNYGLLTSTSDSFEIEKTTEAYILYNDSANTATLNNPNATITNSNNSYNINNKNGNVTLNGGSFTINNSSNSYGIYNNAGKTTVISGDTTITNSTNSYGLYMVNGEIELKSGRYEIDGNTTSYGIKQDNGTFTLGIYDGSGNDSADVSITDPYISATSSNVNTGIGLSKVTGTFNFYDGYVIASKSPRDTNFVVTHVEDEYQVVTKNDTSTGYDYCILEYLH